MPKFIYTDVLVSNIERSVKFYTKELGMRLMFRAKIKETADRAAWLCSSKSKQILELNWFPKRCKFGGGSGLDHLAFGVNNPRKEFDRFP